ncbi:MAG: HU family DNA-binding protein [Phycisphaeraceae bacterium]|nr:HU family DNA-binding protein [Phycisphaeraceae bacterium]
MAKKTTSRSTRPTKKTVRRAKSAADSRKVSAKPAAPAKIVGAKDKPRSKSEIQAAIAEHVGISKKEVAAVFETMSAMIAADLKKGSAGVFSVPGLMKVTVVRKPATKARKGVNPFTGQETTFKAKPARNVVKVRPLKALKDMVA